MLSLFLWGYALPIIGFWIGDQYRITVFPNKKPFDLTSDFLKILLPIQEKPTNLESLNLAIASMSFWVVSTGSLVFFFNKSMEKLATRRSFWFVSKFFSKRRAIEKVFCERAPIEYQLVRISEKYKEDSTYNKDIINYLSHLAEVAHSFKKDTDSSLRSEILDRIKDAKKELKLRTLNYALITLESEKTYICLPLTIPPPDEEAISANSISVIPIMSGYRDKDKALKFTTKYDFDLNKPSDIDCISVDREKIVTVSGFSFETYHRLNPEKEASFGFYER